MDILLKILITQVVVLICVHISMYPDSPIADYIEKRFGDYIRGLMAITGIQLMLIVVVFLIWFWSVA